MNEQEEIKNDEKEKRPADKSEKKERRTVGRTRMFCMAMIEIQRDTEKTCEGEKDKETASLAELPKDFVKKLTSRRVFVSFESTDRCENEPSTQKTANKHNSLPNSSSPSSGMKTDNQKRDYKRSISDGKGRSNLHESEQQYVSKHRGGSSHQNGRNRGSLPIYSHQRNNSFNSKMYNQEHLDLNGKEGPVNKGSVKKFVKGKSLNESHDIKNLRVDPKNPLLGNDSAKSNCSGVNRVNYFHKNDRFQTKEPKSSNDYRNMTFTKNSSQSEYRNSQCPNRREIESKSAGFGRINGIPYSGKNQSLYGNNSLGKQNKSKYKPKDKQNVSPDGYSDEKQDFKSMNGYKSRLNSKRDNFQNLPLASDIWDEDGGSSSISDESENEKSFTKPEKPLGKENSNANLAPGGNAHSFTSPIVCDIETDLPQKNFFSLPSKDEGLFSIPAPHPVSENTFCPISASTFSDDACSLPSKDLQSNSSYTDSADGEFSNDDKSNRAEEPEPEVLEPEKVQAITEYLIKIETERSVSGEFEKHIVKDVNRILSRWAKGDEVVLYGSYLSGLAITTSNLNLALKSTQPPKNSYLLMLQRKLSSALVGCEVEPFVEEPSVKDSKISFFEPQTGVTCEIAYYGKTVCETSNLLKKICEYDQRVKTLIIASRIWAEVCVIHEAENGQLHPVGHALLVVYFLQRIEPPVLPIIDVSSKDWGLISLPEKNSLRVGELWFQFLKYYSCTFDWTSNVVSVTSKNEVLKSSSLKWENWSIAIQDPCSIKNVAETVTTLENAEYLFACFKAYYEYLSTATTSFSETEINNDKNPDEEWKYSFKEMNISRPLPFFCEACEEIEDDELCEKCALNRTTVARTLDELPELNEISKKCIDKALLDVYNDLILSDNNMNGRKAFVEDLQAYIRKIFHDVQLTLFGSSVNKFGIKNSDLDICMTFLHPKTKIQEVKILGRITSHLRKNQNYSGVFGLYSAKVPIVKFHCPSQKWNCDLSLYNVLSVHNSKLLSKYAMIDERCRILGCAMKHLAMKGWIADSAEKTLSSYSYILMVIHYLQQTEPPVLPVLPLQDQEAFIDNLRVPDEVIRDKNYWFSEDVDKLKKRYKIQHRNESSTAELWLGFLEFYLKFNSDFAVTITQKEPMLSSELQKHARLFNIEDPFINKRNLGSVISEDKAVRTLKIFSRARSLFGHNIPKERIENPRTYYFSTNNLTGQYMREMECTSCGAFTHEKEDCLKANPFKKYNAKFNYYSTSFPRKRR